MCKSALARGAIALAVMVHGCALARVAWGEVGRGDRGVVATVHPMATEAGIAALQRGGNAVDAAVAAALTLGVVDGHNSGIGGGCFVLIRQSDGQLVAIDGRETAPLAAHRDMYVRDGRLQSQLSRIGPLASGTPGALAAYELAVRESGRLSLADLLKPAADIAEQGFAIDRVYEADLRTTATQLAKFPATRAILLRPDGQPFREGEILRQPDLARTYRSVASEGTAWFYQGPFAAQVDSWMKEQGGLLRKEDFARYRARRRTPVVTTYRDRSIVGFPPPSSGGVHVAQILNMLEHFDLRQLYAQDRAGFVHVIAEAMKLAFADRAHWLGDGDFVSVPVGLVDKQYAATLAARIDRERVIDVPRYGQPPRSNTDLFGSPAPGKHTTHVAAADAEGNWVALTATVNTTFGSKVIIPGTGVIMNNEMDDFSIQPGVPNAFGLIGAAANAIAPGKRPLSSMSPTIVLDGERPVMTVGAAGGPTIITQVVLAIVNRVDLGLPLADAVAAQRFHHQWVPDRLRVERAFDVELLEELRKKGHQVDATGSGGVTQAIAIESADGPLMGVHDPRVPGSAAGY